MMNVVQDEDPLIVEAREIWQQRGYIQLWQADGIKVLPAVERIYYSAGSEAMNSLDAVLRQRQQTLETLKDLDKQIECHRDELRVALDLIKTLPVASKAA